MTKTDSGQWCERLGLNKFQFWETYKTDLDYPDETCYTEVINLDEYTDDEKDDYVRPYDYDGVEDVQRRYRWHWRQIVAECIFETDMPTDEIVRLSQIAAENVD